MLLLHTLLPEPVVKEMALFGHRIKSDRALACGFVAAVDEDPRAAALHVPSALLKFKLK